MEHGLAGEVPDEKGPGAALAPEGPGSQASFVVAVESNAHVLHVDQGLAGRLAHDLDGVLIPQVVAALHRVICVFLPVIAPVQQRGIDASLRRAGVAAHRMDLADDGGAGSFIPRGDGGAHARQSGSNYQHIVLQHGC